jgi:hypothetical protein
MIYDPIGFAGTATGRDKVKLVGPQVFNPNNIRYKSYNYPSFYSAKNRRNQCEVAAAVWTKTDFQLITGIPENVHYPYSVVSIRFISSDVLINLPSYHISPAKSCQGVALTPI